MKRGRDLQVPAPLHVRRGLDASRVWKHISPAEDRLHPDGATERRGVDYLVVAQVNRHMVDRRRGATRTPEDEVTRLCLAERNVVGSPVLLTALVRHVNPELPEGPGYETRTIERPRTLRRPHVGSTKARHRVVNHR